MISREIRLAAQPKGDPVVSDFDVATVETPTAGPGQILLKTRWISVDPMIRIFISATSFGGIPILPLGAVIPGPAVAEVVTSDHPDFKPGDLVEGRIGWREYAVSDGAGLRKADGGPQELGVLGLPGFSAYVGLQVCGELTADQTVLVSGAAGAVGSVFGPLAKQSGATLVGIASGPERCRALVETLGYDRAVDRTAADFPEALARALPNGADVYFDNVGGPLFDLVLPRMNRKGRVVICGLMAEYGAAEQARACVPLQAIMTGGLNIRAFSNIEHAHLRPAFEREVGEMIKAGRLPMPAQITHGIENVPLAFCRLFTDAVVGKSIVSVA